MLVKNKNKIVETFKNSKLPQGTSEEWKELIDEKNEMKKYNENVHLKNYSHKVFFGFKHLPSLSGFILGNNKLMSLFPDIGCPGCF